MKYKKLITTRLVFVLSFFLTINTITYSKQETQHTNSPDYQETTLQQYIDVGSELQKKENYISSISYFLKAINIAEEIENDDLLFKSYMRLGNSYYYSWKNEKAIEAYYNALTVAKNNQSIDQELIAYSGLIAFLPFINKEDKAVDFSLYALSLIDKASFKNQKNHVRVLTTVCDAYMAQGNYDAMFPHIEKGIQLANQLQFQEGLVDLYIKKGKFYRHQKKYDAAFKSLFKAEKIIQENTIANPFFPRVNTNYAIALCYFDLKEFDKAIVYLQNSTSFIQEKDLEKDNVINTYDLLAKCYEKKENYKETTALLNKILEIKNSASRKKDNATNIFYEQDSEKFLTQIIALQNQGKEDRQTMNYMFLGIILATSAFVLMLLLYVKKQKTNKARFKKLLQKISALEENEKMTFPEKGKNEVKYIPVDDATIQAILTRLNKLEDQEYFLNINCNLRSIAKKTKTNVTYLSQIINNYKEKSFNDYINDLRIEYVLKRLKDDTKFRSFSIKGIANEIGYKSDASFVKHFKNKTGLNPSYYIKELDKIENRKN